MYIISGCLCGVNCKYNGKNNLNLKCLDILKKGQGILVCPEQLGGLTTPRKPSELQETSQNILSGNGSILDIQGIDVTEEFLKGAKEVLNIALMANIEKAILKEGSPSCGVNYVYDGSFSGNKIKGEGITTSILRKAGIEVISDIEFGGDENGVLESI